MDLVTVGAIVRDWAASKPEILRVLLFGSRVKGNYREDSDLDVAAEIELPKHKDVFTFWTGVSGDWHRDLQEKLPFQLQLEWHDPAGSTPTMSAALEDCSLVVYERGA